jgi:hypothetical protein
MIKIDVNGDHSSHEFVQFFRCCVEEVLLVARQPFGHVVQTETKCVNILEKADYLAAVFVGLLLGQPVPHLLE